MIPVTRNKRRLEPPPCSSCTSDDVVPIVYGMPGLDLAEQAEDGKVALGGCCIGEDDPEWHCKECGFEWREGE